MTGQWDSSLVTSDLLSLEGSTILPQTPVFGEQVFMHPSLFFIFKTPYLYKLFAVFDIL